MEITFEEITHIKNIMEERGIRCQVCKNLLEKINLEITALTDSSEGKK